MDYRYERKFLIKELEKHQIESIIKYHKAKFSEIYQLRTVNNIYLDTINMSNVSDNIIGISNRSKMRIRWYGSTFGLIQNPVLEIKIKKGVLGSKKRYPLKSFSLDNNFTQNYLQNIFNESELLGDINNFLKSLKISLLNCYKRRYFESADHKFRITVDSELEYYKVNLIFNNFLNRISDRNTVVLELKYHQDYDNNAKYITNVFPFRMTKSSKYVIGIEKFYN